VTFHGQRDSVTITFTVAEAKALMRAARHMDAHVLTRSAGGIAPSKDRASARTKLHEAVKAV
jgi:hypothetical protein